LKSEVLTETDSIPGPDSDDPHCMLSNVFLNPDKSLSEIRKQYTETKSNDLAMLLSFLGEKDGADQIEDEISKTPWDTGWNYRGMGQFGMSSSPLDVMILAL